MAIFCSRRMAFASVACALLFTSIAASTDPGDVNALLALKQVWSSATFSWVGDPCEDQWLGVHCDDTNSRVLQLVLPDQDLNGILAAEVGNLTDLTVLDLSYNRNLNGLIPPEIGRLTHLTNLSLQFCSFSGPIPSELGNLRGLTFLDFNHNSLKGPIPASIGQLTKLTWLDVSSNYLFGSLPVSTTGGGLDTLTNAKHMHLQNNSFSGSIPVEILNDKMQLIHLLLNNNSFESFIPTQIANLSYLNILRLDFNSFFGTIPESISNLTSLTALQLNHNNLSGTLPDLSTIKHLQLLDLSYNQFDAAIVPSWFSSFTNMTSLAMDAGNLTGELPANIFSLELIENVMLGFNHIIGKLDLKNASPGLKEVDLQQNNISDATLGSYNQTLKLQGNPICKSANNLPTSSCSSPSPLPSSTPPSSNCICAPGSKPNPTASGCMCAVPIIGYMTFAALNIPTVDDIIPNLENGIATGLDLEVNQVSVIASSIHAVQLFIFPLNNVSWNETAKIQILHCLSNQFVTFTSYGTYTFSPQGMNPGSRGGLSTGAKAGIGISVALFLSITLAMGLYAGMQKRRADKAEQISKPFASWMVNGDKSADMPKLKGAQLFSFSDLMKATNNFNPNNEIGSGGYGKVYKGFLLSGDQVAIKRAQPSSMQGAAEFKNEIELLSRVHHKNLVGLVGFCFEQGEQMLVYEYMTNGTLRDCLLGQNGVRMDWQRRLMLALGSAKGLAYLHTEANPPIIHRDIKSSNILLDDKLVAKVADFGLSILAPDDGGTGEGHVSTQVKGTLGYLDPEYYMSQQLTEKSDVYSFGVVLLELLTAKQPIQRGKFIVREVRTALSKGGMTSLQPLLDPNLTEFPQEDLETFLDIALSCVEEASANRPTMNEIVKKLEALAYSHPKTGSVKIHVHPSDFSHEEEMRKHQELVNSSFEYSGSYGMSVTIEPK